MTERAVAEARAYVERSLEDQARLGYARPPAPVVERAVAEAAQAIEKLHSLATPRDK
jgi:hypothetical protein